MDCQGHRGKLIPADLQYKLTPYFQLFNGTLRYLSALYANETFPENGPDGMHNDIRKRLERNPYLGLLCEFLSYR